MSTLLDRSKPDFKLYFVAENPGLMKEKTSIKKNKKLKYIYIYYWAQPYIYNYRFYDSELIKHLKAIQLSTLNIFT